MNTKWLIEDDAFPEDVAPFIDAVKNQGIEYKLIKQQPYEKTEFLHLFNEYDCVVFYGSLGLAKKIAAKANWIPGVYYDVPKYNCTNYYAALGKYLLNGNYIMLPYKELYRQKEFIYGHLGVERTVFMRPNRGDKLFTGQLVYKEEYEKDLEYFNFCNNIKPEELVVVSEPYNLQAEWRFVVVDGQIVTGSQYRENNRVAIDAGFPNNALEFAKQILPYNPEPAWVIDVCLTKGGEYRLMEVGCFSCAGLYKCDRNAIVTAITDVAMKEWQEYQI